MKDKMAKRGHSNPEEAAKDITARLDKFDFTAETQSYLFGMGGVDPWKFSRKVESEMARWLQDVSSRANKAAQKYQKRESEASRYRSKQNLKPKEEDKLLKAEFEAGFYSVIAAGLQEARAVIRDGLSQVRQNSQSTSSRAATELAAAKKIQQEAKQKAFDERAKQLLLSKERKKQAPGQPGQPGEDFADYGEERPAWQDIPGLGDLFKS